MSIAAESAEPTVVIADPAASLAAEKVAIPEGWAAKMSLIVLITFPAGSGGCVGTRPINYSGAHRPQLTEFSANNACGSFVTVISAIAKIADHGDFAWFLRARWEGAGAGCLRDRGMMWRERIILCWRPIHDPALVVAGNALCGNRFEYLQRTSIIKIDSELSA